MRSLYALRRSDKTRQVLIIASEIVYLDGGTDQGVMIVLIIFAVGRIESHKGAAVTPKKHLFVNLLALNGAFALAIHNQKSKVIGLGRFESKYGNEFCGCGIAEGSFSFYDIVEVAGVGEASFCSQLAVRVLPLFRWRWGIALFLEGVLQKFAEILVLVNVHACPLKIPQHLNFQTVEWRAD